MNIALISTLYEAAKLNDLAAMNVLSEISDEVITIVNAFRRDMVFDSVIRVVLEGSVFKNADEILINMIQNGLGDRYKIVIPQNDPVTGALLFALEDDMKEISDEVYHNLMMTYKEKVRR